ncbi:glycine-rich cell wall structural protein-like [Nymphaea colorata]|uniref:glycine-rich cell wall structural protein-like n=1 Tax=Nymphaea colorata TaxID=210225 RepID=UPI00129DD9F6|nr:glycine-rich cell wall structural protein-like [Nymphaea colorata]
MTRDKVYAHPGGFISGGTISGGGTGMSGNGGDGIGGTGGTTSGGETGGTSGPGGDGTGGLGKSGPGVGGGGNGSSIPGGGHTSGLVVSTLKVQDSSRGIAGVPVSGLHGVERVRRMRLLVVRSGGMAEGTGTYFPKMVMLKVEDAIVKPSD